MSDCPACKDAESNPRADEFAAGCNGCTARALAATRADLLPNYKDALRRLFGVNVRDGDRLVAEWRARIKAVR